MVDPQIIREIKAQVVQEVLDELRRTTRPPLFVPLERALKRFKVSKSSFDRWWADPASGLRRICLQPGGPGGKITVPLRDFERWLRERTTRGTRGADRRP